MKKIIFLLLSISLISLLNGCAAEKRQYFKIANVGSDNFEVDKAQCEYQAELNTQMPNHTDLTINIDNRQGDGSTNYSNVYGSNKGFSNIGTRSKVGDVISASLKKDKLTDLCLKSMGWSWKVIEK